MAGEVRERIVDVLGLPTRLLESGAGTAVVLLHDGLPGLTPYCSSADDWAPVLPALAQHHRVLAVERPGAGGSEIASAEDLGFAAAQRRMRALLEQVAVERVHLVGHGDGGLLALALARDPALTVLSCTLIAATSSAPTGDSLQDLTLLHPPEPLWTRESQLWAVDRLSSSMHHVTAGWVAALERNWRGSAHRVAAEVSADPQVARHRRDDELAAKSDFLGYSRDTGFTVPIELVWGSQDPTSPVERAIALFDLLSPTVAPLSMHIVNHVGHFPMRENPTEVLRLLLASMRRAEASSRAAA